MAYEMYLGLEGALKYDEAGPLIESNMSGDIWLYKLWFLTELPTIFIYWGLLL